VPERAKRTQSPVQPAAVITGPANDSDAPFLPCNSTNGRSTWMAETSIL